jgi:hypothetical protein
MVHDRGAQISSLGDEMPPNSGVEVVTLNDCLLSTKISSQAAWVHAG